VAAILEDEDVDSLEMDVVRIEADRVPLKKNPANVTTVDAVITFLRSAGRNFVDLNGYSYLILILLPRVVLLRLLHPFFLALSQLYCHMRSMIDSDS